MVTIKMTRPNVFEGGGEQGHGEVEHTNEGLVRPVLDEVRDLRLVLIYEQNKKNKIELDPRIKTRVQKKNYPAVKIHPGKLEDET